MALYLLDTDICSYVIRNRPPQVRERMNALPLAEQAMSVVTYAELVYGVKRSSSQRVNRQVVDAFVRHLTVIPWDRAAAEHYGDLRANMEKRGAPIGAMDLRIAAHARSLGAVMVTHNRRHFEKVPGLKVESWV
jgi:tRNA(fMet)-specific endonuclease VapC